MRPSLFIAGVTYFHTESTSHKGSCLCTIGFPTRNEIVLAIGNTLKPIISMGQDCGAPASVMPLSVAEVRDLAENLPTNGIHPK